MACSLMTLESDGLGSCQDEDIHLEAMRDLTKLTGNRKQLIRSSIRLPQSLGSRTDVSIQKSQLLQ